MTTAAPAASDENPGPAAVQGPPVQGQPVQGPRRGVLRAVGLLLSVAVLHAFAVWPLPWDSVSPVAALSIPNPDVALLLGWMIVVGGLLGWRRCAACSAALLLMVIVLLRAATSGVPLFLERPFTLREFEMLPALQHYLLDAHPPTTQTMALVGAGLAAVVLFLLLAWAFARVALAATSPRVAAGLLLLLQGLGIWGWAARSCCPEARTWHASQLTALAERVYVDTREWLGPDVADARFRSEIAVAAAALDEESRGFERLAGADVYVLFIESYGHLLAWRPELAAAQQGFWREMAPILERSGFTACSVWCHPEIVGASSWIAHSQLFSGVKVRDQREWIRLLQSSLRPLPARFRDFGYQTVEVSPAVDVAWQVGKKFYGFDEHVTQRELGYQGLVYPFGRMPDQYALQHLLQNVVRPASKPLFATFVSVSSHVPWSMIPPYVDDWSSITPTTFAGPPAAEYPLDQITALAASPEAIAAYGHAIRYSLRVVVGFLEQLRAVQRPALVLVLGDHQPPIARKSDPPDLTRHVPIHAFANKPDLLAPFLERGWHPGVEPGSESESFGTDRFAVELLREFRR